VIFSDLRGRFRFRRMAREDHGNVAIEFAFIAPILIVLIMNVLDFSALIWDQMEVDYSAQMGAQAAYKTCNTAVTTAVQSTSLSTGVTLASGYPTETYYCVSGTTLESVASYPSSPPANCSAYGNATVAPGDYIQVNVNYLFSPTFSGLSLASARTLAGNSMQRLN
jgi:Flp pilus assembly protein TadG